MSEDGSMKAEKVNGFRRGVSAGVLGMLLCSGAVNAVPVSSVATGTGDVVFRETGTASIEVTPVSPLQAGVHNGRVIATAVATATGGPVAYRWSPSGSVGRDGFSNLRILSGKADTTNKLSVSSVANATLAGDGDWFTTNDENSPLTITVMTAQGDQVVAADTFVVSLDAAVWGE